MTALFLALALARPAAAAPKTSSQAPSAWLPKIPRPLAVPIPDDPLRVTIHRLPNGLTVYLSPNHERPRITSWIAVRVGSKYDPAETTGLAHYLEHMLFKGTTSMGTIDYAREEPHLERIVKLYEDHFHANDPTQRNRIYREIDAENLAATRYEVPNELDKIYNALGFRGVNAFTSDEQTVYVEDFPSNRAAAWARVESARFAAPVFRLFQSELEAVYEEKNRSLDNAERLLEETVNERVYKIHPYGQQTTLGRIEHLKNPSLRAMYDFYRRYYVPNNMAIALSGDFEPDQMLALIQQHFGGWIPKPLPPAKTWPVPKPKGAERAEVRFEAEEKVVVAWLTAPHLHPDADALTVMDMVMDNSAAGLLNLQLNQAQKVKASGSSPTFYNEAGDWEVWAVPKRGQTLEQAEALLMQTIEKLKLGEFTDDDLKAIITNFEVEEKARLESNDARVAEMAGSFTRLEPWERSAERLERLKRVTRADVLRVANQYLGDDRVVVYRRFGKPQIPSIAKPGFTEVPIDESRLSTFAASVLAMPAKPLKPRWLAAGRDYDVLKLPEGKLYAAKNPFDDLFSLSFEFERGRRQSRDICAALEVLELSGAGGLSAEEFKRKLYALGTTMSVGCAEQDSTVTLTGLDRNLWLSLELLRQRFEAPAISTETLKKFIDVQIGAHQDVKRDPDAVFGALHEWASRGAESPVLGELSDAELNGLRVEPLRALVEDVFGYERRVAYVGNRPPGEVAKLIETGRRVMAPERRRPMRHLRPARPMLYFTQRDMVQARVGVFAADEPFDPAHAVDYAFYSGYEGGGMSSVIFQEIREARSLAYSAWGGYEPAPRKEDDNAVLGQLGCQADKTPEAARLLRDLLAHPPLSPQRFEEVARAIQENYRANPIPFRQIPSALMEWEDQGISGGDPRPQRFERALRYRLSDLESFSRRFNDRPMTLYILGDRARVGEAELKKLGELREKKVDELFPF